VKWLDLFIDGMHRNAFMNAAGSLWELGPVARIAAVANVVIAGAVLVVGVVTGIAGQAPGFGLAAFGVALEVVFVRVCVRTFRGDFDPYVLAPDDDEDDGEGLDTTR
jgi:hypothetical protein